MTSLYWHVANLSDTINTDNWNSSYAIFSSLVALQVATTTTCGATSDDKSDIMIILSFQQRFVSHHVAVFVVQPHPPSFLWLMCASDVTVSVISCYFRALCGLCIWQVIYRQIYNIRRTKSQNLNLSRLVLQLYCLIIETSKEWRCSWSSADRRCSNYIWVINNFIVHKGASYVRGFTVVATPFGHLRYTSFSWTLRTLFISDVIAPIILQ